ncbi:MAG: response regulator [Myxococcales bacterium]|nr:response regulator [Myxococcales bacterium]MCB9519351.1 response regulator [Myxococcales bacterium]
MSQKILVIDDSRTVRTVVEWVFHGSPYVVIGASTASEGLRLLRSERPTAVLVDYTLPDQAGYDVCAEIRRDPQLQSMPIVMLGGTFAAFDERRAVASGADDVIVKPFKTDALIEKVASVIGRAASRPVQLTPDDLPSIESTSPPVFSVPPQPAVAGTRQPDGGGFRRVGAATRGDELSESSLGVPPLPTFGAAKPVETPPPQPVVPTAAAPAPAALPLPALDDDDAEELELEEADDATTLEPQAAPAPVGLARGAAPAPLPLPALDPMPLEPLPLAHRGPQPASEPEPVVRPMSVPAAAEPSFLAPTVTPEPVAAQVANAPAANSPAVAAPPIAIDEEMVRAAVKEALPTIVKDVLATLLRQTIGARVEQYASKKIDDFIETDLPAMAEKAIEERLAALYDQG